MQARAHVGTQARRRACAHAHARMCLHTGEYMLTCISNQKDSYEIGFKTKIALVKTFQRQLDTNFHLVRTITIP